MNVDSSAMGRVPSFGDRESGHSGALKAERQFSGALRPDTGRRLKGGFGRGAVVAESVYMTARLGHLPLEMWKSERQVWVDLSRSGRKRFSGRQNAIPQQARPRQSATTLPAAANNCHLLAIPTIKLDFFPWGAVSLDSQDALGIALEGSGLFSCRILIT